MINFIERLRKAHRMGNSNPYYNRYSQSVIEQTFRVFYCDRPDDEWRRFCEATAFIYRQRMGIKPGVPFANDLAKEEDWLRFGKIPMDGE